MKGPNPFVLYEEDPMNIVGRKEEARIFNTFINAASSKQPGIIFVTGGPGIGKTALLQYFSLLAEKNGLLAPYVKAEKGENLDTVIERLGKETEKNEKFGTILFIDDIDKIKKSSEALAEILEMVKSYWGKKNISFVLSSTKEFRIKSHLIKNIQLKPFDEHQAREVVEKALKKGPPKMGEECFNTIFDATSGNPLLFKTVCHHIYGKLRENEKIISKGHYLAYLQYIMSMLSREWFGALYQGTPKAEREILLVLAKNEEMHVSDIAKELGKNLGPVTALTKRLLEKGLIVKIDRGRYKIFAKLYGKYILQRN